MTIETFYSMVFRVYKDLAVKNEGRGSQII